MRIILAGSGQIGYALIKSFLDEGHDLTIIDEDQNTINNIQNTFDVMTLCGNCATASALHDANIEKADLLIAVTSKDEINLLACMTSKSINPKIHTIARIRNPEYANQVYSMQEVTGLSLIVNPEQSVANEIYMLLKMPGFLRRESFARGQFEIVELKVDQNSVLNGLALNQLPGTVKCKALVCAIVRNDQCIIPRGNHTIEAGDRIFVAAPTDSLSDLLKNVGVTTKRVKNCMIIGGGRSTYYLGKKLIDSGIKVKIIEPDPTVSRLIMNQLPKASVIQENPQDQDSLIREGIEDFDSLVSLTSQDAVNAITAMFGTTLGIQTIISKFDQMSSSVLFGKIPIGSIVRPQDLASNAILRYVRAMQNQSGAAISIHNIADGKAEALEFEVNEHTLHIGEPLKSFKLKDNVLISCITTGSETSIPNGDSKFNPGDTLVIVSSHSGAIAQLNDIFA
ncbi:MAG: Trk system potassium transporter TrkA [Clostridia bacterium]|nr:Trk system potassium transporter TrkA [Clostridia bacterium]